MIYEAEESRNEANEVFLSRMLVDIWNWGKGEKDF